MGFLKNISTNTLSDAELVAAYKQTAEPNVIGELYQRYMELVYGVCLKYLKQPENAQDCVINIFEELVIKLPKHEVESFKGWLYTLAKNHCLMRLRSAKKTVTVNFDVELMQSEENVHLNGELDKEENFEKMDYCLSQLEDDQRKVIEAFYLQGKCYNEITAITGLEWNKVRSFIQNGRRNLKICMESQKKSVVENAFTKNNGFTAKDIERYHAGTMSMQERHALEKAALDDPFLADALEGYQFTATPQDDLALIKERLKEKTEKRKPVPVLYNYQWLKIAAVILVMAGSGWLAFKISSHDNSQNEIAFQPEKKSKQTSTANTESNETEVIDSALFNDTINKPSLNDQPWTYAQAPSNKKLKLHNNSSTKAPDGSTNILAKEPAISNVTLHLQSDAIATAPVPELKSEAIKKPSAPTDLTTPARNGYVNGKAKQNIVRQDNVSFLNRNNDSLAHDVTTVINDKQIPEIDTISNFNVVMKPDEGQLSEVVILSPGKKKTDANARYPRVTIDTLEPAEGVARFDDYIVSNLKSPEGLQLKSLSGREVQLSFDVNNDGEPVNITVVKSLCEKCDEEAIRLLKEGPKWKKKKNKKARSP